MKYQKGQSGNPKGRPKGKHSLAEAIRSAGAKHHWKQRDQMIAQMWADASSPELEPGDRAKAAEWIAKHGWPEESRGQFPTNAEGQGPRKVIFEFA